MVKSCQNATKQGYEDGMDEKLRESDQRKRKGRIWTVSEEILPETGINGKNGRKLGRI